MTNEQIPEEKRVFFGWEALAPWPQQTPKGRILREKDRHVTLAFLGEVDFPSLQQILPTFPPSQFSCGLVGICDQCLFLPPRHPRVVAWHIDLQEKEMVSLYQQEVTQWLLQQGFSPSHPERDWLPHITLARAPFDGKGWEKGFSPLPVVLQDIHLYQSLGASQYQSLWRYPLLAPFESIEHTADIAFLIRGHSLKQIHRNAQTALAFEYPPLVSYFSTKEVANLEDIVVDLNRVIAHADIAIGVPFKAVSYHGSLMEGKDRLLNWEMIVDV